MRNKSIWLGMMLIFVFAFAVSSCEILEELITVPKWAQGTWDANILATGVTVNAAVRITDKKLIPTKALTDISQDLIKETDVTITTEDTVTFGAYQVKKIANSSKLELGLIAGDITLAELSN